MSDKKQHHLFIATPAFGFQVYVNYANGLISFIGTPQPDDLDFTMTFHVHAGGALISHARNDCVHKFLQTDCTKLLFIDADIGFTAENIWRLLRKDEEFVIAPYVTKSLNRKEDSKFILGWPDRDVVADKDGFVEITSGPAGFMMIDRSVFEKMDKAYPELRTKVQHLQNGEAVQQDNFHTFFDCTVEDTRGSLGEDIAFCKRWTDIGGKIYCDTRAALTHYGVHCFQGQLMQTIEAGLAGNNVLQGKKTKVSMR